MDWKESIRAIKSAEGLTGIPLLRRLALRNHNSPALPPQAFDGDDVMPLIRRLTAAELTEFGLRLPPEGSRGFHPASPVSQAQPNLDIRVHVLCSADDNGSNGPADPKTVAQWISAAVDEANAIYAAFGAGIRFQFNPGDISSIQNTLVNQDFTVPPGTNMRTDKNTPPLSDDQITKLGAVHETERNKVCGQFTERCVFLLAYGTSLEYNDAKKEWEIGPRTGYAYSWEDKEFVAFPALWGALHGPEVAHESGHYLHLWHTHSYAPKTLADAAKIIKDNVDQKNIDASNASDLFDGDKPSGINDTPPDPGPELYASVSGAADDACIVSVSPKVDVSFADGTHKSYTFACDRGDVMSYFKDCGTFSQHFSSDQIKRMRDALVSGNRRRLVGTELGDTKHPQLRYSGLWNQGQGGCVWWPACTEAELRQKTGELWPTMRLKQMTGFVLGGEVRFSCIWVPGTYPQVWLPNCSDADFRGKTDELWKTMRVEQVHAFVVGSEVRYSCLWRANTSPQVWWENCSEDDFRKKTGEIWNTMRPAQMQPFVVGGQVRYSALWNAGTDANVWWPNCTEAEFRSKTDELWHSMRPSQLAAFRTGGNVRFSAIWRSGTAAQVWWPECTEEQLRQKTDDTWSSMRPELWMPVSI